MQKYEKTWASKELPTIWDVKKQSFNDGLVIGIFGTLFVIMVAYTLLTSCGS